MKLANLDGKPEIFLSYQGEGATMGTPCIFVRLSQCNLHCIWCDTDYTWNWEGSSFLTLTGEKFKKSNFILDISIDEVCNQVLKFNCKHIVITGGEPLLQQKELIGLIRKIKQTLPGVFIELETNGTLVPLDELDINVDQYNVSLKLKSSNVKESLRLRPRSIDFFKASKKSFFKFVLSTPEDRGELLEVVTKYEIPSLKVFLMPEGTSCEALDSKSGFIKNICSELGFRFTDRKHVREFGSRRGV